jgi:hypothetical protein
MADKHLYDEEGNYKGRISDAPPTHGGDGGEALANALGALIGISLVVSLICGLIGLFLLFVLSPGIAFNKVAGRKVGDPFLDTWTWIIAIASWVAVFYLAYLVRKKAKQKKL